MIRQLNDKNIPNPHLVAMAVPKSMLEQRDVIAKGMSEINIIFRNQVNVRQVDEEIAEEPTANTYVDQFNLEKLAESRKGQQKE